MNRHKAGDVKGPASFSPIVELRQYTLHPGQRDVLIELFERAFIEVQEAGGATVIGQFSGRGESQSLCLAAGLP